MIHSRISLYTFALLILSTHLLPMFPDNAQLEFGINRKEYNSTNQVSFGLNDANPVPEPAFNFCPFCSSTTMATNHVISEDNITDTRIMMNKFPYPDFDQAAHLLCMPVSHKEQPDEFSREEINNQANTVQELSSVLHTTAYTQEHFTNWGCMAGQSVAHWHSQFKSYEMRPMSMPDRMNYLEVSAKKQNASQAYESFKFCWENRELLTDDASESISNPKNCLCCNIYKTNYPYDSVNYVIARFKHNFLCLSHYPKVAAELSVVPNKHAACLKHLSQDAWQENMAIAMALLPIIKQYAHENVRNCGGVNTYTFGYGGNPFIEEQSTTYHLHTRIMPRTTIRPTPSDLVGNSCVLECKYDPLHLYQYLLDHHAEALKAKILS